MYFCTFCLLQIFEWWYFKKYGTSFIEQVSLNHISPLLGGEPVTSTESTSGTSNGTVGNGNGNNANNNHNQQSMPGRVRGHSWFTKKGQIDETNVNAEIKLCFQPWLHNLCCR